MDALLHPLILSTIVDDEHLATPTTPVLHCVGPHSSNLTHCLLTVSMNGRLSSLTRWSGIAVLSQLLFREDVALHVTVEQWGCVCVCVYIIILLYMYVCEKKLQNGQDPVYCIAGNFGKVLKNLVYRDRQVKN